MFVLFQYPDVHDVERFTFGNIYLKHHHSIAYWGHGVKKKKKKIWRLTWL